MKTTAQMSTLVKRHIPDAQVIGHLRDRPGILIRVPIQQRSSCDMYSIEQALLQAGATGWHWSLTERPQSVKIRVYYGQEWRYGVLMLPIVVACAIYYYDILHHFAKIAGRKLSAPWG